jgi:nucleoid-associated protein YgaU
MSVVTRELKLSLILGFSLVLVVTVLVSDYLSKARSTRLDGTNPGAPVAISAPHPNVDELKSKIEQQEERLAAAEREQALTVSNQHPTPKTFTPDGEAPRSGLVEAPNAGELAQGNESEHTPLEIIQTRGRGTELPAGRSGGDASPAGASKDRTHTVVSGDTLYQLAQKYYRNGSYHAQLQKYNKLQSSGLKVGTTIKIPTVEVLTGRLSAPTQPRPQLAINDLKPLVDVDRQQNAAKETEVEGPTAEPVELITPKPEAAKPAVKAGSYTVKKGDTLGHIAQRELGTSKRSSEILSLNSGVLKAPEDLRIGMVIKLPAK